MTLRLAYFYDTPLPSQLAAPIQILQTCCALAERDVPVTFYCGPIAREDVAQALAHYGLHPHANLSIVPLFAERPKRAALQEMLDAQRPDVIVSRGEQGIALFPMLRPWLRENNARFVYEAHRLCHSEVGTWARPQLPLLDAARVAWRGWRMKGGERRAVEEADGLICLTEGVRTALCETFSVQSPTLILPSGTAAPPEHVPAAAAPERDIDILYAGKLARRKGVFDLICAMRYLPRRLWLLGGTAREQQTVRHFAAEQGVAERVEVVGYVAPAEIRAWYLRARVGVCPLPQGESKITDQYTSPLKILEMMACGVPVVATRLPTVEALVQDGQTALLAPPNDPAALANRIEALLCEGALAQRLADAARCAVVQYAWPQRAARMESFVRQLIGERG